MQQKILDIQQKLLELKQDRTKFFTVPNILAIYHEFKTTVDKLSEAELQQNHSILSDCLLIFSLAFNTVGFTRQPIAVYARAVTLRTVFKFIHRDPAFTPKELQMLKSSIRGVKESLSLDNDSDIDVMEFINTEIAELVKILEKSCDESCMIMNGLPEEEYPVYSQITHLRRATLGEVVSNEFDADKFSALSEKLSKVQSHVDVHADHKPEDEEDNSNVSPLLRYQLRKARILIDLFKNGVSLEEMDEEDKELRGHYEVVQEMLPVLDVFVMTRRWTLRVTDLYEYMKTLLRLTPFLLVDEETTIYRSADSIPNPVQKNQKYRYLLTYMARKAWALIFKLLDTVEPVSEALYSSYNQLLTMKRCLGEVRLAGGISNLRELYPYQLKLTSLDSQRKDGKFLVNDEVPPGQGVLNSMLAECFDIVYELKVELEEKGVEADDSNLVEDEVDCSLHGSSEDESDDCYTSDNDESILDQKSSSVPPDDHTHDHLADVPDANE